MHEVYFVSRVKAGYWADFHLTEEDITDYEGWLSVDIDCGTVVVVPPATGICLGTVITAVFVIVYIWSAELHSVKSFKVVSTFQSVSSYRQWIPSIVTAYAKDIVMIVSPCLVIVLNVYSHFPLAALC